MIDTNHLCADVGTVNCPCPLAETGDCLICSRLAGRQECDCCWAGVCVYNEYIQNDQVVRNKREDQPVPILKKIRYDEDLMVLVLKVSKGFALKAMEPGSFVFVNGTDQSEFSNIPVSVMMADAEKGRLYLALKIISGKTKLVAEAQNTLMLRGVYRNGLLGRGKQELAQDVRKGGRWLIITKGVGFAPAVNLLRWAEGRVAADLLIDTEKVNDEIIRDYLRHCAEDGGGEISYRGGSLQSLTTALQAEHAKGRRALLAGEFCADDYDRVILLTSDYYIKTIAQGMEIPAQKLVFCNNFRMCCGEGICGACGHIDGQGGVSKMCKCRDVCIAELV